MAQKISEDTNVTLDLKTIGLIVGGVVSLTSMYFVLKSDIALAMEKPELEIIKSLIKELSDKEDDPMQVDVTDTDVTVTKGESKVTASKKK